MIFKKYDNFIKFKSVSNTPSVPQYITKSYLTFDFSNVYVIKYILVQKS